MQRRKKALEARKQSACDNRGEGGHFAAHCQRGKLAFHVIDDSEDSRRFLEPYVLELVVNGKPCRVLHDSVVRADMVYPS